MSKAPKNAKFRAAQKGKTAVYKASQWAKLISSKIYVAEKTWNFCLVYSQLDCQDQYFSATHKLCEIIATHLHGDWV